MNEQEFTKTRIYEYLKGAHPRVQITPGEDPPDYTVTIDNVVYGLEITNAETLMFSKDGKLYAFRESAEPLLGLHEELNTNKKISNIVPKGKSVFFYLKLPILNYRRFKVAISKPQTNNLNEFLNNLQNKFPEDIGKISIIPRTFNRGPILLVLGSKGTEYNIQKHIRVILKGILRKKEAKLNKVNYKKERWLGIKINHFFTEKKFWMNTLNEIDDPHTFRRVLFVNNEGNVYDCMLK